MKHDRKISTPIAVALLVFVSLIILLPLSAADVPPLLDYPNHLARMHVLATQGSENIVQDNYDVAWRPIPNLAMDLVVPLLVGPFTVYDAGRVFLAFSLLSVFLGIVLLHRVAFGKISISPLAAGLVVYNLPFAWGFINFYTSIGVCLAVFAAWMATRNGTAWKRVAFFNVATSILYLTHLFGLVAYCFAVLLFEAGEAIRTRDFAVARLARHALVAGSQIILPVFLYVSIGLFGGGKVEPLTLGSWFGDVYSKISAPLSGLVFYGGWPDLLPLLFIAIVLALSLRNRWVTLSPLLKWPVLGFLFLTLMSPNVLRGIFVDSRAGAFLACFTVAALRFDMPSRAAWFSTVALIGLIFFKSFSISAIWYVHDKRHDEFREALRVIEPGKRVFSAHDIPLKPPLLSYGTRWYMAGISFDPRLSPLYSDFHIETLAVIERGAFVPTLFSYPSTQPIQSAPRNLHVDPIHLSRRITTDLLRAGVDPAQKAGLLALAARHGETLFWMDWPRNFDYVIVFNYETRSNPAPDLLELAHSGSTFDIYRVRKSD